MFGYLCTAGICVVIGLSIYFFKNKVIKKEEHVRNIQTVERVVASRNAFMPEFCNSIATGYANMAITNEGLITFCQTEYTTYIKIEPILGTAEPLQIDYCHSLSIFMDQNTVYFSNDFFENMTYLTSEFPLHVRQISCTAVKIILHCDEGLFLINASNMVNATIDCDIKSILITPKNKISFSKEIKFISCGYSHVLISTLENELYGMGTNSHYELGIDNDNGAQPFTEPILIPFFSELKQPITTFSGGRFFSVVKADNIYSFGSNQYGQLGFRREDHQFENNHEPIKYFENNYFDIKQVSCGRYHTIVLMENGEVHGFGNNTAGQLGIPITRSYLSPKIIEFFDSNPVDIISCGDLHTLFYTKAGEIYICGFDRKKSMALNFPKSVAPTLLQHIPTIKISRKNRFGRTKNARFRKKNN